MNNNSQNSEKPQSDVYVELFGLDQNKLQNGVIFSRGNSLKQDCKISYEPNENPLPPGIYSFDLFYEPDITVDDAAPNQQTTNHQASSNIILKLNKPID
ncbi:hypothetical protein MG290_01390 [Flavobacterium sp. CBA20B-1]|uniref:hypothetical protein n=1 Tax=unclassified Flavobacterium TaxID=196869 RepID=UPI0022248D3D|nr:MULTISPECIES: hypothetical protein [unclassified Flavobacterium]WCM42352.1 hypothetical protein MG290_01390 [Flavobacterium sp. CBA20B-1]